METSVVSQVITWLTGTWLTGQPNSASLICSVFSELHSWFTQLSYPHTSTVVWLYSYFCLTAIFILILIRDVLCQGMVCLSIINFNFPWWGTISGTLNSHRPTLSLTLSSHGPGTAPVLQKLKTVNVSDQKILWSSTIWLVAVCGLIHGCCCRFVCHGSAALVSWGVCVGHGEMSWTAKCLRFCSCSPTLCLSKKWCSTTKLYVCSDQIP